MKTIDVVFNNSDEFATGCSTNRWSNRNYSYFVTDEQARRIETEKTEFAVVRAPTNAGGLKVVKIVGQPSDTPEKATRRIVDLVDMAGYEEDEKKIALAKDLRKRIEQRAEEARLAALAKGDPAMAELLEQLKALGV